MQRFLQKATFGIFVCLPLVVAGSVRAQTAVANKADERLEAAAQKLKAACGDDLAKYCSSVTLGEGAFFGEMALLGNNLRSANITTRRLSKLLVLDLVDFRVLMARHPDLAETIDAEAKRRALENK